MKIVVIGKFPPLQGGVSARTYCLAHGLAELGHQIDVVTNALEANAASRMFFFGGDQSKCEATYGPGYVKVHWTVPYNRELRHIPNDNPMVSKLASLGLTLGRAKGADAIFSFYMEPYAIAGHLVASALSIPHIVRTAGSDVGRLWNNDQLKPVFDAVFDQAKNLYATSLRHIFSIFRRKTL